MLKTFFAAILLGFALGGGATPQDGVQIVSSHGLSAVQQGDGSFQVVPESFVIEAMDALPDGSQSVTTEVRDPATGDVHKITTVRGELETLDHWMKKHLDAVNFWKLYFANEALKKGVTTGR